MSDGRPVCYTEGCGWAATYWYQALGQRVGMCFGHATAATQSSTAGQRVRKDQR